MVRKVISVALWTLAAAVGFHFVFTPFYDGVLDIALVWEVLNWFMAAGILVVAVIQFNRQRGAQGHSRAEPLGREYLAANAAFYASAVLALLFFWNWIDALTGTGPQSDTRLVWWAFIDSLFVLVLGATGCYLWGDDS